MTNCRSSKLVGHNDALYTISGVSNRVEARTALQTFASQVLSPFDCSQCSRSARHCSVMRVSSLKARRLRYVTKFASTYDSCFFPLISNIV